MLSAGLGVGEGGRVGIRGGGGPASGTFSFPVRVCGTVDRAHRGPQSLTVHLVEPGAQAPIPLVFCEAVLT